MVRAHQTIRVELVAVWVPAVAVAEAVVASLVAAVVVDSLAVAEEAEVSLVAVVAVEVASLVAVAEVEEEGKYIYHLTI